MISAAVTLRDDSKPWLNAREEELSNMLDKMATAIKSRARIKAPNDGDNRLASSGNISGKGLARTITFGSGLKYGAYQERGERYNGTHKVKRYTKVGTGKHYLKGSGDGVVKEGFKKYL